MGYHTHYKIHSSTASDYTSDLKILTMLASFAGTSFRFSFLPGKPSVSLIGQEMCLHRKHSSLVDSSDSFYLHNLLVYACSSVKQAEYKDFASVWMELVLLDVKVLNLKQKYHQWPLKLGSPDALSPLSAWWTEQQELKSWTVFSYGNPVFAWVNIFSCSLLSLLNHIATNLRFVQVGTWLLHGPFSLW